MARTTSEKGHSDLQIISYLSRQSGWTPAAEMADFFHVSVRTLKNRIYQINAAFDGVILSSNRGYQLDTGRGSEMVRALTQKNDIPDSYEKRKEYILKSLLLDKTELRISDLMETFFVSDATLQKDISKLRSELAEERLILRTKKEQLLIVGSGADKQKFILKMIQREINDSSFSIQKTQKMFTTVNLMQVRKIVTGVLGKYEYFLDNYALLNYVLHLALTIELKNENPENQVSGSVIKADYVIPKDDLVQQMILEIYEQLKKLYNTEYTLEDIIQASVLMSTRVTFRNLSSMTYEQIRPYIDENIPPLLEDIILAVQKNYAIDLGDDGFKVRFALHLKRLLVRLENHIQITNIQFDNIKNEYPYIYAVALSISKIIINRFGYPLPEEEISYIALHIGVLIEEKNALNNRIRTLLVCHDYQDIAKNVFKKLNAAFSESLFITDIATDLFGIKDFSKVDFVISTSPVSDQIATPNCVINPLLPERDMQRIMTYIKEIRSTLLRERLRERIIYFFKPDLFFADSSLRTDKDIIETLCDEMIAKEYVSKDYKEQIYEHEALSPSSYGKVAIPHPLSSAPDSSVIAVSIHSKPVQWGMNEVYLVFMLSLAERDKELFQDVFSLISRIIGNEELLRKILQVQSYDEFINIIAGS